MRCQRRWSGMVLTLLAACAGQPSAQRSPAVVRGAEKTAAAAASTRPEKPTLEGLAAHCEASRYAEAEALARPLLSDGERRGSAHLWLARVMLATGRYEQAADHAQKSWAIDGELEELGRVVAAQALVRRGQLVEAEAMLAPAAARGSAWTAKRMLGEVLLAQGRRKMAEPWLHALVEAYNDDRIAEDDALALTQLGRAADLLRSPHDANDAYNLAEQASEAASSELLLWRALTFLDNHDPEQAEQVLSELLARAPQHALALALMARVKLAQTMDFASAEALARRALAVDPKLSEAHFVIAGVRLRDLELVEARRQTRAGLAHNPRDLELLSLRATADFLAGDTAAFTAVEREVLALNGEYTRFYSIVAEYADWEHRYHDVVDLLERAVRLDAKDAAAHAGLGMNLIRLGDDVGGRAALRRAFAQDPFNARVHNTLNLFEQVIDVSYETVNRGPFRLRFQREERPVLERHVPALLGEAWQRMVEHYGITPSRPLGIELYDDRQHFAVRTSGLPNIGIQGVCFGNTLAVVTPRKQPLNLGMTLWHELAHVFHIQASNSRVPRWFTEGLAEYETLMRRPEWSREHDLELYKALREGKLPSVLQMNRAFSHAESLQDMAVAYYASAQLVTLLAQRHGWPKLRRMLELWGAGHDTAQVLQAALGTSGAALDAEFRAHLEQRLARYRGQFVALEASADVKKLQANLEQAPRDRTLRLKLALSLFEERQLDQARALVDALLEEDARDPQAGFLQAQLALAAGDAKHAAQRLQQLLASGHDGYEIQVLLAKSLQAMNQEFTAALRAAHAADPTQSEVLYGLWRQARRSSNTKEELEILRKLARIDQHAPDVYQRLLELLLQQGTTEEALAIGESAILVDMEGAKTHRLYAEVLVAAQQLPRAEAALESAIACPGDPSERAQAHRRYADLLEQRGSRARAAQQRARAAELEAASVSAP